MSQKIIIPQDIIIPIFERTKSVNQTAKELGVSWSTAKKNLDTYGCLTAPKPGKVDNYNLFLKIENQFDAYWLGILYSDGWIRSDRNIIGLGSIDLDLIEKWKDYTKTPNKIYIKSKEKTIGRQLPQGKLCKTARDFYQLTFSSKKTKENLIALGCMPAKSKILQCPTREQVPDKLLWHFFRGLIDGDGWITYNPEKYRYRIGVCGTQHLLEVLLTRLKILHYGRLAKKQNTDIWEFSCESHKIVDKLLPLIYKDAEIYLDRKYNSYLNFLGRSSI